MVGHRGLVGFLPRSAGVVARKAESVSQSFTSFIDKLIRDGRFDSEGCQPLQQVPRRIRLERRIVAMALYLTRFSYTPESWAR